MKRTPGMDFLSKQVTESRLFSLDLRPPKGAELAVACGGREFCAANYRTSRTGFRFFCVEFVAQGRGSLLLDGREVDLRPGAVFTYGPGVAHEIVTDPRQRMVKYFVDFTGTRSRRLLQEGPPGLGRAAFVAHPVRVLDLFDSLIDRGAEAAAGAARACALLLELLILEIGAEAVPEAVDRSPAYATYIRCRDLLEEQALDLGSGGELARRAHVDEAYLCRLFRRFGKESPHQALLRIKMRRAAVLLQEPGTMVKQAAQAVGFADPYHFSRVFKQCQGMAPEKFARLAKR